MCWGRSFQGLGIKQEKAQLMDLGRRVQGMRF